MNDVERLESLRGRVQHLGTVSIEDTRWLWEMARCYVSERLAWRMFEQAVAYHAANPDCGDWAAGKISDELLTLSGDLQEASKKTPPLAPQRKRCRKCDGDGAAGWKCDMHGKYEIRCPACGGSGYQQSGNPGEFGGER